MDLRELDVTIFSIKPWKVGAEKQSKKIANRLYEAIKNKPQDKIALELLYGYLSIAYALEGIAYAQFPLYGLHHGGQHHLLFEACNIPATKNVRYTRGWSVQERRFAFAVDYALNQYLSGHYAEALGILRGDFYGLRGHVIADFMAARMLIEKGKIPQVQQGLAFLEAPATVEELSVYSQELADLAPQVARAVRRNARRYRRRSIPAELRLTPRSLGWWVGKYGWQGRG